MSSALSRLSTSWSSEPSNTLCKKRDVTRSRLYFWRINEGPPLSPMLDQALVFHDPQHGLNGVEGQFALGTHPVQDLANAGRA